MWLIELILLLCLLGGLLFVTAVGPRGRYPDPKKETPPPPKPKVKLNVDILPPLQDVLSELNMTGYIGDFVRMGVTETRLLLRLSSMDFHIMSMDWKDFKKEMTSTLKDKIKELLELATVVEEPSRPELAIREKLHYGRLYLPMGVQSLEFNMASFGGPPPLGTIKLEMSKSLIECNSSQTTNYNGNAVLVMRGNCTFLEKALNAKSNNASGMLVVSTEDTLDSPASGVGINKTVTEELANSLGKFYVVSLANTSWTPLSKSIQFHGNKSVDLNIVPLKCSVGRQCAPVTREELELQAEVSWGRIRIRKSDSKESRSFEFLTSNFGTQLPVGFELPILLANPTDACDQLSPFKKSDPFILVAYRGSCRFDLKALNAEGSGARLLMVIDMEDNALQRLGGMTPEIGYVGIPSIITTLEAGLFIQEASANDGSVIAEIFPAGNDTGREIWMELAYTQWSEIEEEQTMQLHGLIQKYEGTENNDAVRWLYRRLQRVEQSKKKSIETDEL